MLDDCQRYARTRSMQDMSDECGFLELQLYSNPSEAKSGPIAHIAQSVEHFLGKEEVTGSNPVVGSNVEFLGYRFF